MLAYKPLSSRDTALHQPDFSVAAYEYVSINKG